MPLSILRRMVGCRWAARSLQRYLDRDLSGLLPESDVRRLELHLQTCQRCQGLATEYRSVARLLGRLGLVCEPDPVAIGRTLTHLEKVLDIR